MVETLNIGGRGIYVLVDLLNSQAESVFPKPLCTDFTPNLGLFFLFTTLYHFEELLIVIFFKRKTISKEQGFNIEDWS